MKKEFIFLMFAVCFALWVIVVDNMILPKKENLRQKRALFSRYRVKEWRGDGKLNLVKDKIVIYAHLDNAEEFYYLEYKPQYEAALKMIEPGATINLRYSKRFPKLWQRTVYRVDRGGLPVLITTDRDLKQRQMFIWKFTAAMGGLFILLSFLGFLNKPRPHGRR